MSVRESSSFPSKYLLILHFLRDLVTTPCLTAFYDATTHWQTWETVGFLILLIGIRLSLPVACNHLFHSSRISTLKGLSIVLICLHTPIVSQGASDTCPEPGERPGLVLCYVSSGCLSPHQFTFLFPRVLYSDALELYARATDCSGFMHIKWLNHVTL